MFKINRRTDKSAIMLMLNTILFGTGAGLVSLAWRDVINQQAPNVSVMDAMFDFQQPLLLITVAILLGGVFHSFTILYPTLVADHEEQQRVLNEASDYRDQAHRDALTNLHNRRYFDATLEAYLYEFGKMKMPFALLIIDVDHFKAVNDTHGHQAGDQVLKDIAQCIRSQAREHDIVARVGGEEFAVILAKVSDRELPKIAERYRAQIERLKIEVERGTINPTVSLGAALSSGHTTVHTLLELADERLYQAKDAGRNLAITA
ncbi:MAG: GGDEF domain-containing protein [Pseudomonadota bacterium]